MPAPPRAHLIAGGFPRGSAAGHDIDYARLRLLGLLQENDRATTTISSDFDDVASWLERTDFLITYVAGPFPDEAQCQGIASWLERGGRWLALHGTSGGQAVALPDGRPGRMMARKPHHDLLGCFFLNHPPIREFRVEIGDPEHPLTRGLPDAFSVQDELYLLELTAPEQSRVLLTTRDLPASDPAPRKFGFTYDEDTSIGPDGSTRALGYVREVGAGAVTYFGLGHCHTPSTNIQPFVDASVDPEGTTPPHFRGPWETRAFSQLLRNAVDWGLEASRAS